MKKMLLISLVAIAVISFLTCVTFAQDLTNKENWQARAGVLWQQGNSAPQTADWTVGVEYMLPKKNNGCFSVTADFIDARSNPPTGGVTTEALVPVLVNYKFYGGDNFAITAGAGIFAKGGQKFAWQVMADYYFTKNWFIEGRYLNRSINYNANSFYGAELGYKF
jgi:hypothetical protein